MPRCHAEAEAGTKEEVCEEIGKVGLTFLKRMQAELRASWAWVCPNFLVTGFLLILRLPGSQLFLDQSLG